MKRALQTFKPWLPAIAYMATIVVASSQPAIAIDMGYVPLRDKGVHFIEYGVLAVLIAYALTTQRTASGEPLTRGAIAKLALWAVALTTIFGYLDELHQAFVPGRNSDVVDLLADFLGSIAGTGIYFSVKLAIARKRSRSVA